MNSYTITVLVDEKITSDGVACLDGFLVNKNSAIVPIQVHAWGATQEWLRQTDARYLIVQGAFAYANYALVISATGAWPISAIDPERLISQVNLVGRAGQAPEARFFDSGSNLAQWSMATNNPPRRGDPKPKPDWHNIKTWGMTAEIATNYVRKGDLISVTGRLEIEAWTDRATGDQRWKPVVTCQRLELLGSRSDAPPADEDAAAPAPARPSAPPRGW